MFKTFNMGWGFGIIVDKADTEKAIKHTEAGWREPRDNRQNNQQTKSRGNRLQEQTHGFHVKYCFFLDESV